jgi:outer membrane protein OmpA-like peptidoglycan-associated protein
MQRVSTARWGRILLSSTALILAACATANTDQPGAKTGPDNLRLSLASGLDGEVKKPGPKAAQPLARKSTGTSTAAKQAAPEAARPSAENNIFFSRMSAEMPIEADEPIHRYAEMLKADPHLNLLLIGHTEPLGSQEYCIALASRRTHVVAMELVKLGVRPLQIREHPQGCDTTAAACRTSDCNDLKRRVEFQLQDKQ